MKLLLLYLHADTDTEMR